MLTISSNNHGETAPGSYMGFIDLLERSCGPVQCCAVPFSKFAKTISKGGWRAQLYGIVVF